MKRLSASVAVNGLLVLAAAIALAPLLWMASVSLMRPGEADSFPPPLLPASPSLAAYGELFAHHDMGRYFANSLLLASAATVLSLVFNVTAGYAFAKLRFAGRERMFQA
ncbi:MAG: carbohydrate ABC transporter permease, partial [Caulobacteraceae bacterium]